MARSKIGSKDAHMFDAALFALEYTGELRKHISIASQPPSYLKHSGFPDSWDAKIERQYMTALKAFKKRVIREREAKLGILAELFQVNLKRQDGWKMLALLLAVKHVPGFKVVTRKTRPIKWTPQAKLGFYLSVEDTQRRHNCGKKDALRIMAQEHVRQNLSYTPGTPAFSREVSAKFDSMNSQHSTFKRDKRCMKLLNSHHEQEKLEQARAAALGKTAHLLPSCFAEHQVLDTRELYLRSPFHAWGPNIKVPQK